MLQGYCLRQSRNILKIGLRGFCRWKSDDLGLDDVRSIKASNWPIIKGHATPEETIKVKSNYRYKRIINTVPKTGWEVSAIGYGKGGSRVYNDDWSGELQRACRFGTNLIQITIGEEYMDENHSGNPSGYIHPHGMLHGLLIGDDISRGSMVFSSKIYSHQRTGQAYSSQQLQKMVDISLSQLGIDTLDMLTLEIPPFITESQLAMALYHIKTEINNGRVSYFTMGGTFPFTAEGSRPVKKKNDSFDPSEFSYSFIKMMNMIRDLGLLDHLIGIQVPLNISENAMATSPLSPSSQESLSSFFTSSPASPLTLLEAMQQCNLAVFVDRCFEGYKGERPVRLIDFQDVETTNLLMEMKEAFEIARYLEDLYAQTIRPGIEKNDQRTPPPAAESFQFGYLLPTLMTQAGSLMVWEDLRHTALEPSVSDGISRLTELGDDVKKWCFSYRLATTNMFNIITKAFKAKEIGYIKKVDSLINSLCSQYREQKPRFYYKMLDSVLSLGVTSVFTDMIHVHGNDISPPLLTREESKEFMKQFKMPEDDVHLISMNDYEFKTDAKDIESVRQSAPEINTKKESS